MASMSAQEIWQQAQYAWPQELNTGVTPEGPYFSNDAANVTASIVVDQRSFQSMIGTACFNFLQFLALLAFIWLLLLMPRLYFITLRFHTRMCYVFNYEGPDHETMAARIAELVEDRDRRRLTLKNAKYESAVMNEQNSRDIELLNAKLQEVKQLRRKDKRTILTLDGDLQCARMQLSGLYKELAMTRTQRSSAIKQAEDAENRANSSNNLLKLRTRKLESYEYTATKAEEDLHSVVAAMRSRAPESQSSSALAETKRNAAAEKTKMEEDHSTALNAATAKRNADATAIANLKDEVKRLKANIQGRFGAAEKTRTEEEHSTELSAAKEKAKADAAAIAALQDEVDILKGNAHERSDAIEKTRAEEEHSRALSTASEKAKTDAAIIAALQVDMERLKANIQEPSETVFPANTIEMERLTADLASVSSKLEKLESIQNNTAADLASALSSLETLKLEKEEAEADLSKAKCSLSEAESDREKILADLTEASSQLSTMRSQNEKVQSDLTREIQNLRSHVCDHTKCQQQLQEASQSKNELQATLKQYKDAHRNTAQELDSMKRNFDGLKAVHSQCKPVSQHPVSVSNDSQDEMEMDELAAKPANEDDMDVDTPQQILIDRLELAQQEICKLKVQNESLLEAMRGNREKTDLMDESPDGDAEARIREEVNREFREERGGLHRQIEDQAQLLKKKDEQLKSNNVSQRLQDELKASKERTSKLEYDLSILQKAITSKPSTPPIAPTHTGVGQPGPSAQGGPSEETIKLRRDLQGAINTAKRLNKETKAAKADYDRVRTILEKKDPKASEEYRNVEKARSELGAEIESLEKKIARLEAGVREEPRPPPASDTAAPGSDGGKRAREGDEETEGEATKKLKA